METIDLVLPTDGQEDGPLLSTEALIERARSGERLNVDERRQCITFLLYTEPYLTNGAIAAVFGVSESQIRKDKKLIEEIQARETFDSDVSLVVSRTVANLDSQIAALEISKSKATKGGRDFVLHCKTIADLSEKKLKILTEYGFVPTNIGTQQTASYSYAAVVTKGDNVDTRPVEMFDKETQLKISQSKRALTIEAAPQKP